MHLRAAGCGGRTAASPRCQSSSSASTSSSAHHQPQIPLPASQKQQQQRDQAHTTPLRVSTRLAAVASPDRSTQQAANYHDVKAARLITAIKTPYLPSGSFDLEAFDRLVLNQIEHGVEGLIIGGTTGEGHLMSWDEHIMLIAHTVLTYRDRLLVIGNTGSNATKEAVHATAQGFNVGMHASLQVNPYYGKTSSAGLLAHFGATLALGPGMVYNVPGRTGQDIPDDVILRLAGSPNFLGVKECTGNNRIASYADKGVTCWSGNDDEAHAGRHQYGAQGVVSVASNLIPGLYAKLMKERDDELMDSLQDLVAWLFCEPNPIGLDTALMMCGLVQPVFRLPYVPLDKERRIQGAKLLEKVGEHIPGCTKIDPLEDSDFTLLSSF